MDTPHAQVSSSFFFVLDDPAPAARPFRTNRPSLFRPVF